MHSSSNQYQNMKSPGTFSISLDFELHWGCFEHMKELNDKNQQYFKNTRAAIPQMLSLFETFKIHVTWASVGMLFNKNVDEWKQNVPAKIPGFMNEEVSAYKWVDKHGFFSEEDPFHFAPQLVQLIKDTPFQEIGTHTYAHYFCLEKGQTAEQFREDLIAACKMAKQVGIEIRSLVFPRNQFNKEYLSICKEMGITSVRSNPDIWYWTSSADSSLLKRLFRTGDAYLKFQPYKMVFLSDIETGELPVQLPATRLYRPWKPKFPLLNKLKMRRILNEMTAAAQSGGYYHIWWHPHNLGYHPNECLLEIRTILEHFKKLKAEYGFESLTMSETTEKLIRPS